MKTEDLQKQGLTQEQIDFVMAENGKDLKKLQKEVDSLTSERDSLKERAETAEETLKGFEGKDFDTITKERDEWKKKAEDAEKDYSAKIAEREKADLLKEAFEGIEFTSEAAKKAIMAQIAESVSVKNGKLIGFNDLLEEAKSADASAFVDKEQKILEQNRARFTDPMNKGNKSSGGVLTKKDIMAIKDPVERQQKIAENMSLFQK